MLLVVGGHSRNIGKTGVMSAIIAGTAEARWQAVKITQYGYHVCHSEGQECKCAGDPRHPYALDRQEADDATDSGRFLGAGAERAWWLRTRKENLGHALPVLKRLLAETTNTIVESNSILQFIQPDLYAAVIDFSVDDMKDSFRKYANRADVFVIVGGENPHWQAIPGWQGIPVRWFEGKPAFRVSGPDFQSPELIEWVRSKLTGPRTKDAVAR